MNQQPHYPDMSPQQERASQSTEMDAVADAICTHGADVWNLVSRLENALHRLGRADTPPAANTISGKVPEPNGHMNRISNAFGGLANGIERAHQLMEKLEKVL